MADTEKSTENEIKTETEAAPKPKAKAKGKAKAKAKAKAKPKAKAKDKPKAKTASKKNTADVAPYQSKGNKAASSQAQKPKQKFSTTLLLIAILAIVVITTTYQLNIQISELSAQDDSQENSVNAELDNLSSQVNVMGFTAAPAAESQAEPANINEASNEASAVTEAPKQDAPSANQAPPGQTGSQAITQVQARSAKHYETMQQRHQAFEKRMQLKQQEYEAIVEAHKKERAKLAAEQNDVMLRIRKKNEETKLKVDEIRKQIYDLHQQINQIMRESSQVRRQP